MLNQAEASRRYGIFAKNGDLIEGGYFSLIETLDAITRRYNGEDVKADELCPKHEDEPCCERCRQKELEKLRRWERQIQFEESLAPCPWCGIRGSYSGCGISQNVGCINPDCPIQPSTEFACEATFDEMLAAWNTRKK